MQSARTAASPWQPLAQPVFRAIWIASLASNLGTVMHDTAAAWLMTSLAAKPILVALMQTATSLPFFLLGLPAGALADVVDRRRLLLATQTWMLVAAGLLGVLTVFGWMTAPLLLSLTFFLGLGVALNSPAWQAVVPELVERDQLPSAVALNGVAFNLARAAGPALGGLIVAASNPGMVFLLNAASFVGVIFVIRGWQRPERESMLPPERILGAIRAGARYVQHSPEMRAVLVRAGVFILGGSVTWALLPVLVRRQLGLGPAAYGTLLGCFGAGAVAGAMLLPGLQARHSADRQSILATLAYAAAAATLGLTHSPLLVGAVLAIAGAAWMVQMSCLNVAAQTAIPAWVRARAMAVYLLIFQGGLALGSILWGAVATAANSRIALLAAAAFLAAGTLAALRFRLADHQSLDLSPFPRPHPELADELHPDRGPVLITVQYRVDPADAEAFTAAMCAMRRVRRRDGAYRWGLFQDTAQPERFMETFVVESWAEHLRQHERFTVADREVQQRALAYHRSAEPPVVEHLIYAYDDAPR